MKRLPLLLAAAPLVLLLGACEITLNFADSQTTAAALASIAGYEGGISPGTGTFPSATATPSTPSFSSSAYYGNATANGQAQSAYFLNGQPISLEGGSYRLTGTVNYSCSYNHVSGYYSAYIFAPSLYIQGPDYVGTTSIDLAENFSVSASGYPRTMNAGIAGWVGGSYLSSTTSFWF